MKRNGFLKAGSAFLSLCVVGACHSADSTSPAGVTTHAWAAVTSPTAQTLSGLWGTSDSNIWAVGLGGTILHFNGSSWAAVASGTTENIYAVWGATASDVWAVGANGTLLHYNGTAWTAAPVVAGQTFNSVWGSSSTDVWAGGRPSSGTSAGTMYHYNGTSWSAATLPSLTSVVQSIWGTSASNVYAATTVGDVLHFTGSSWALDAGAHSVIFGQGPQYQANAIGGSSAADVWVGGTGFNLGGSAAFFHYNGTAWSNVASGTTGTLQITAIWGNTATDSWAVTYPGGSATAAGQILHWTGTAWTSAYSTGVNLFGIWGTSSTNVWAVGQSGTILHLS